MTPGIALVPADSVNHLDHIVPLCSLLEIPLIADPHFLQTPLSHYYPQVNPIYIDNHVELLDTIARNTSVLFVTSASYKSELSPMLELVYGKNILFWYCSHGNSDKSVEGFRYQDFAFTYGNEMEKRLEEEGILTNLLGTIKTGNYRLSFYQQHRAFYDALIEKEVFEAFEKKQTTLLYAPTWDDLEDSSSFKKMGKEVIETLPSHLNLVVKLHPWTVRNNQEALLLFEEAYGALSNVVILKQCPLIYPLLNRIDLYLGDYSSIGYDFLYTLRPMFFFETESAKKKTSYASYLHQCGHVIPKDTPLYSTIEKKIPTDQILNEKKKRLYQQTFADIDPLQLKKHVIQTLNQKLTHEV